MFNVFLIWTIVGDGERGLKELLAPVTGRINTAVNNANLSYQPQGGSAHTDRWLGDDFLELDHPTSLKADFAFIVYSRRGMCIFIFFVYKNAVFVFLRLNVNSSQICIVLFTKHVFSMQFYRKSVLTFLISSCLVTFSRLNSVNNIVYILQKYKQSSS